MNPKNNPPQPVEMILTLPYGKIAAKAWGDPHNLPTLGLHGWLDNAATFDLLAPLLPEIYLISIDLPGHGFSDHKPLGHFFHIIDYVVNVLDVADHLGWSRFAILGHSFGSAIGSLLAGTFPEKIVGLGLIDALGPLTTEPEASPGQLRSALTEKRKISNKIAEYPTVLDAAKTRAKVGRLLLRSAEILALRGTKKTDNNTVTWCTDRRLLLPACSQLTEAQAEVFLSEVTAPSLLIRAEPGFPFDQKLVQWRLNASKTLELVQLKGGHHIHLDEPEKTAKVLRPFFQRLAHQHAALSKNQENL